MTKAVSVVMSVYNGEAFLREAVESILNQSFSDFEFVIVNDGSRDKTAEILATYTDSRLRVLNQENKGLAAALNHGLRHCSSDIVIRMDADDISFPERFELLLADWEKAGRPDVFGSGADYIDMQGNYLWSAEMPLKHDDIRSAILNARGMVLIHPSVLFLKASVLSCGGYDEYFRATQDFDLWLRMADHCRFGNTHRRLIKYRFMNSSMTANAAKVRGDSKNSGPWMALLALQKKYLLSKGLEDIWSSKNREIRELLQERIERTDLEMRASVGRFLTEAKINYYGRNKLRAINELLSVLSKHPVLVFKQLGNFSSLNISSLVIKENEIPSKWRN
jgi:glycosyltransferase involved in cell wall biosynthesis